MSRPSLQLAFARSRRSLARPSSFQPATLLPSSPARRPSSSSSGSLPPSSTAPYRVFDRANVLHHRQVAFQKDGGDRSRTVGYLREEIGERVMERFEVGLLLPVLLPVCHPPVALLGLYAEGPALTSFFALFAHAGRQAAVVRPGQPGRAAPAARPARDHRRPGHVREPARGRRRARRVGRDHGLEWCVSLYPGAAWLEGGWKRVRGGQARSSTRPEARAAQSSSALAGTPRSTMASLARPETVLCG